MATAYETETGKAPTWTIDPAHSSVEFAVKHMVITTVRGGFSKSDIDLHFDVEHPERSSVEARLEAASIDTKVADRDAHLRSADFLDAERYPNLIYKSRRVEVIGEGRYRVVGDLIIRDVTREVILDATFSGIARNPWGMTVAGFSAETKINRKDWGLVWNAQLETGGVLVGDEVKINLEAEAVRQG